MKKIKQNRFFQVSKIISIIIFLWITFFNIGFCIYKIKEYSFLNEPQIVGGLVNDTLKGIAVAYDIIPAFFVIELIAAGGFIIAWIPYLIYKIINKSKKDKEKGEEKDNV